MTGERAERWVVWASVTCAVHCLALPVMVVVAPWFVLGEIVERGVLVLLLPVTALLSWRSVRRHGRWTPCAPVGAGLVLWSVALAAGPEGVTQALLLGGGGMFVWLGLRWSARMADSCGCSACEA